MKLRQARENDMETVYMMGFDAWGKDLSEEEYLRICRSSLKYARGTWYILEDKKGILLSSLLLHNLNYLNHAEKFEIKGIGSISTPPSMRKRGYGSQIVRNIMEYINSVDIWFLYSDIETEFYRKLKFTEMSEPFQKYSSSILMFYSRVWNGKINFPEIEMPDYF